MNPTHLRHKKKMYLLVYGTGIALTIIIAKLVYLQITLVEHFTNKSQKNFLRTETILAPRGNIIDRNGILLATNRPIINLYWQGTGNNRLTGEQEKLIGMISSLLELPLTKQCKQKHHIGRAERTYTKTLLAVDINTTTLSALQELFPNHPNILLKTNFKRFYPHNESASHLIGYLGTTHTINPEGKMGIESLFNTELQGHYGTLLHTINSFGRKLHEKQVHPAHMGNDIHTTLDLKIQTLCQEVFTDEYTGTFIVMAPETGDILALLSRPTFNPNIFLDTISSATWQSLQAQKPFLNRALNATYPLGSIFKLITVSAALEHNIIHADSVSYCKGYVTFGERNYWCHRHQGHGKVNVTQAVAQSCNTLCFNIGKQLDIDILASYAHIFGLGSPTGILLPEKQGLIPNRAWKKRTLNQRWYTGETLSACIGQSYINGTPMQAARLIAGIFTGNLPRPRILLHEPIHNTPLLIKDETRSLLQQSMKMTVEMGTGQYVNANKDFHVYAKTSTAQTSSLEKRTLGKEHMEHGWFVAHVGYKNNDPITIVILVEHAGTSKIPTAIAKKFLLGYKKLIDGNT